MQKFCVNDNSSNPDCRGNDSFFAGIATKAGIGIVVMRETFVPKNLLKERPDYTKTQHKIMIRRVWSGIKGVSSEA